MTDERRDFDNLNGLDLSNSWWDGGGEWTSIMRKEISQPGIKIDEISNRQKLKSTNRSITYTICALLMLISVAVLTRVSVEGSKPAIQVTDKKAE